MSIRFQFSRISSPAAGEGGLVFSATDEVNWQMNRGTPLRGAKWRIGAFIFVTVLLGGCSNTQYTEYHGSEVFQGKGGAERMVDGIGFWENGEPGRKYRILGVIAENRKNHGFGHVSDFFNSDLFEADRDSAIAKEVRKRGGDAVILVAAKHEESDPVELGDESHQRFTLVVIKYVVNLK